MTGRRSWCSTASENGSLRVKSTNTRSTSRSTWSSCGAQHSTAQQGAAERSLKGRGRHRASFCWPRGQRGAADCTAPSLPNLLALLYGKEQATQWPNVTPVQVGRPYCLPLVYRSSLCHRPDPHPPGTAARRTTAWRRGSRCAAARPPWGTPWPAQRSAAQSAAADMFTAAKRFPTRQAVQRQRIPLSQQATAARRSGPARPSTFNMHPSRAHMV